MHSAVVARATALRLMPRPLLPTRYARASVTALPTVTIDNDMVEGDVGNVVLHKQYAQT
jgi:hypothetical protein